LPNAKKLQRISAVQLETLLARAHSEQWDELVLAGLGIRLSDGGEDWPDCLRTASRVFQLSEFVEGLAHRLRPLTNLTSRALWNNRIGAEGAKALCTLTDLTKLTSLDLYCNQLTALPAEIGNLTNLVFLDLRYNQLTALPAEIGNLRAMRSLELDGNALKALLPEIGQLTALTGLNAPGNPLPEPPLRIAENGVAAVKHYFSRKDRSRRGN
jgi:hypothetical protein